jgi:phosphoribosyl 1,2-cyclic phosphodiesterase
MRVRFWGTRGSIPVALTSADIRRKIETALTLALEQGVDTREKLEAFLAGGLDPRLYHTYGGHSPCVEIETGGDEFLVCDIGSGARALGARIMAQQNRGSHPVVNLVMSHVHWDHIMGFPFFAPAYMPGATIRIHGCHAVLEQAFRLQQSAPCFPVDFSRLGAKIEFIRLEPGGFRDRRIQSDPNFSATPGLVRVPVRTRWQGHRLFD